ncbi:MAG: hypothetical protein MJ237_00035 [bacterium]|nr:hypothetical protein [bacterium]
MAKKIVLISDDSNFFDYMKTKPELRKSDELFCYSFDNIPKISSQIENAVLIVNSENANDKVFELLNLCSKSSVVIMSYNEDPSFTKKCYRAGAMDCISISLPDSEFRARLIPVLRYADILDKNSRYREMLVDKNILDKNNEVYFDYKNILDRELEKLSNTSQQAVFMAISPDEKSKFLINSKLIETIILDNMRRNDILMNYAPNKYFLLMFDIETTSAEKYWNKIEKKLPKDIYVGMIRVANHTRQKLINDALCNLHEAINNQTIKDKNVKNINIKGMKPTECINFKLYRQEFEGKLDKIITPVFYQIQQKYSKILSGTIEQIDGDGFKSFNFKFKNFNATFKISYPGFAKINIDVSMQYEPENIESKRITLNPEELEAGVLEDLMEQFMIEIKSKI